MKNDEKGFAVLPAALVIMGAVLMIGVAVSTRTASTTRQIESARARRLVILAARCAATEAAAALEKAYEPALAGASPQDAATRIAAASLPRTLDPVLTRKEFSDQKLTIGAVSVEMSRLKDKRWGVVQLRFDLEAPSMGQPLKRRVTVRRYLAVRRSRAGVHVRISDRDVARAVEVVR